MSLLSTSSTLLSPRHYDHIFPQSPTNSRVTHNHHHTHNTAVGGSPGHTIDRTCGIIPIPIPAPAPPQPPPPPPPYYHYYPPPPAPPMYIPAPPAPAPPAPPGLPGGSLLGGLLGPLLMPVLMLVGMLIMRVLDALGMPMMPMPPMVIRQRNKVGAGRKKRALIKYSPLNAIGK